MTVKTVNPLQAEVGDDVSFKHGRISKDSKQRTIVGVVHHIVQPDKPTNRTRCIIVDTEGGMVTCHISRRQS